MLVAFDFTDLTPETLYEDLNFRVTIEIHIPDFPDTPTDGALIIQLKDYFHDILVSVVKDWIPDPKSMASTIYNKSKENDRVAVTSINLSIRPLRESYGITHYFSRNELELISKVKVQ